MSVESNVRRIQDAMSDACAKSGRAQQDVTLIAVTKFVPVERIAPAIALGIRHVGENRAQEFLEKLSFFEDHNCTPHFIGQLQSNKVKYLIGQVALIQSVDRLPLAQEIERQASLRAAVQDILVEVNIGREAQKGGIRPEELTTFLEQAQGMPHIRVCGLMCVPPAGTPEQARPYFSNMRTLFEHYKSFAGMDMQHLSMGMSGDFHEAILEGATMVRVGSALFGSRM